MQDNSYTRYRKRTLVQINLTLNRNTDADILAWLDEVSNMSGSIKAAIREYMRFTADPELKSDI